MARISSYPRDLEVDDQDAWIGTESSNRLTRNFTAEAVAKYLNIKGKISISAQMVFKFTAALPTTGTFTGVADGTPFANITSLDLAIKDSGDQNVVAFVNYLIGNQILISEQNAISNFGHYTISSYTNPGSFVDSYALGLTYIGGNGNLEQDKYYDFAEFSLSDADGGTGVFPNVSALVWTIDHAGDWGPYPSVTVVNNNDIVMYGNVEYITTTQLTITFSATFAGTAYLN